MQIVKMLCPSNKYYLKCPYSMDPEYITVHNTANDAGATAEVSFMIGNGKEVSFHAAVDDNVIVQGLPFDRNAWACGDGHGKGNRKSISIEICYSKSGGTKFDKAEQNAAKYIAILLKERNWGIERIKRHKDWSGKYCPHRTMDNGWERFLNLIRAELGQATVKIPTNTSVSISKEPNCTGDITYQAHDGKYKWNPEVINDNGNAGNSGIRMDGLRAKPKYGEIKIQTRLLNTNNFLDVVSSKNYIKNDSKNGNSYSGIYGKPIDGVKIWATKGYVEYRVKVEAVRNNKGQVIKPETWLPWVRKADNTPEGYAGVKGRAIVSIQMK